MIDSFPSGESCFVDANILGYASIEFIPLTAPCRAFLGRVAGARSLEWQIQGWTPVTLCRCIRTLQGGLQPF